jgi:hypothetical protein
MIALRRSKVQTQRDVLAGKSPAIQINVNATRMSQAFAGSSYIQQIGKERKNRFSLYRCPLRKTILIEIKSDRFIFG